MNMRYLISLLFASFALVKIIIAQPKSSKTIEEEILELEKSFADAIKSQDTGQTKNYLSDKYFLAIGVQGMSLQIVPRDRWLSTLKAYVTTAFSIDDIKVNVYGKTAVATLLFTQQAKVRGQDRSGQFMLTDIWVKGTKGWMIAERHSSRPEPPAITRPQ